MTNSQDSVYKHYNVQSLNVENLNNADGNPAGGTVEGTGIEINWQNGGRRNEDGSLAESNGAFVEDAIYAALQRLQYFQDSKFRCRENAIAITHLEEALWALTHRRLDRADRNVEGAQEV